MNPYSLLSNQKIDPATGNCIPNNNKANYYQELGIRVPQKSVNNPNKLLLLSNDNSVTNKSLAYQYKNETPIILYSPMNDNQLKIIKLAIKQSNTIDGSTYYFGMNMIENKLNVINNLNKNVLSINLNPLKKQYKNEKFDSLLVKLFRASRNILS